MGHGFRDHFTDGEIEGQKGYKTLTMVTQFRRRGFLFALRTSSF